MAVGDMTLGAGLGAPVGVVSALLAMACCSCSNCNKTLSGVLQAGCRTRHTNKATRMSICKCQKSKLQECSSKRKKAKSDNFPIARDSKKMLYGHKVPGERLYKRRTFMTACT